MMKKLIGAAAVLLASTMVQAERQPELSIQYGDWDAVLKATVLDTGISTRSVGKRTRTQPGTRVTKTNDKMTRNEANRVFYHALGDGNKAQIRSLVDSLASVPTEAPLDLFPADEQLAYWLNLHNAAVYSMLADAYPETNLKSFHRKNWDRKWLNVGGDLLSVADIERNIMARWQNPLVFYGFYQGHIGSPNLRREAYTGGKVWQQLRSNAREFVRSLRGLQVRHGKLHVSSMYEEYEVLFGDVGIKLRTHLAEYAGMDLTPHIHAIEKVKPSISDWNIADLHNGHLGLTSSANTNAAGFINAIAAGTDPNRVAYLQDRIAGGKNRFPAHVVQFLHRLVKDERHLRTPEVSVEEVDAGDRITSSEDTPDK